MNTCKIGFVAQLERPFSFQNEFQQKIFDLKPNETIGIDVIF